ncbi:Ig-like domain-containing protein [Rivibacter subsaxonicus]|uniref:Ig-like domain-containing protein n=1 Tax=Rivibacter subsaxonicus TaxID=457575 RepID=UPI00102BC459|nr:Ig-like domain-containing protein [Rivibacter subsaxonicus]
MLLAACGGGGGEDAPTTPVASLSAADDEAAVAWTVSTPINVLANDVASAGTLELVSVSAPAHGSAQISGGRLIYTPAPGYFGADALTYTVRAVQGGATSSARVSVTVNAQIRLRGLSGDPALPNAVVVGTVGTKSFQTTTDAAGQFTLTVEAARATDMVQLASSGNGAQASVKFGSLVGDVASLLRVATSDGEVTANKVPALNITPISTAFAALAREAGGRQAPATQQQLDAIALLMPLHRVADLATAIRMVANGSAALPPTATDTALLVEDPSTSTTLAAFLSAHGSSDAFMVARKQVLSSSGPSGAADSFGSAERSIAYVLSYGSQTDGLVVTYRPDGTASVVGPKGARAATWTATTDAIRLSLSQPYSVIALGEEDPIFGWQTVSHDTTGYELRLVRGTAGAGSVIVVPLGETRTLDGPLAGRVTPIDTSFGYLRKSLDLSTATAFGDADMAAGNRWAGVLAGTSVGGEASYSEADAVRFAGSGAAVLERTNAAINGSVVNGWLRLEGPYGDRRYLRLSQDVGGVEEHWIAADFVNGAMIAANEIVVVRPEAGARFDNGSALQRRWLSGFAVDSIVTGQLVFDLNADGTNAMITLYPDGSSFAQPGTWSIDAVGNLTQIQGNPMVRQRDWTLLKASGSKRYVMERLWIPRSGTEWWRVNVVIDQGPAGS